MRRSHLALIALLLAARSVRARAGRAAISSNGRSTASAPCSRIRRWWPRAAMCCNRSRRCWVTLVPFADAHLPMAPERAPKSPISHAGFVRVSALPKPGTYRVTLSEAAWIDVIQDGAALKAAAHSGATGCDGVRRSLKFELAAEPMIIELSGTTAHAVALVVTPD